VTKNPIPVATADNLCEMIYGEKRTSARPLDEDTVRSFRPPAVNRRNRDATPPET
jgi:hypothetical protein